MYKFRLWFIMQLIKLCDYTLKLFDDTLDQEDINEVVRIRNEFLRKKAKLRRKLEARRSI